MAIYHLTVKSISRGKGSAKGRSDYIEREGKYQKDAAEIVHKESGNMPAWAEPEPREYWQAADDYERANGRLFKQVEFALPRELTPGQQIELARAFCRELAHCPDGPLPYSMAIHQGHGQGNPHCHLMISERVNDGHDRSPATWFKRASPGATPETGGAKKTTALHPQEWLISTREKWADRANIALARAGHHASIDHRTLAAQGISRIPTYHLGPAAAAMERKGNQSDRGERQREEEAERQRQARALEETERQTKDARALMEMIDQGRAQARAEYEAWKTDQRQRKAEQERQRQREREEQQRRQRERQRQDRDRGPSMGM